MKKILFIIILAGLYHCSPVEKNKTQLIGPQEVNMQTDRLTPEVLWSFGRIGEIAVSPDGNTIAYTVTYYSVAENKSNTEIFSISTDGSGKKQLTYTPEKESNLEWSADGKKIYFISYANGSSQVWQMNADGSKMKQISDYDGDIQLFKFSPDGTNILFVAEVKTGKTVADVYPDLPNANALVIDDLMYRHWDTWEDDKSNHIFIAGMSNENIGKATDIMPGEPYDTPLLPFGGPEEISWNHNGTAIAYTCKKTTGKAYTLTTNSDIYIYDLKSGKTINFTDGMKGYDRAPVFSPDGNFMAWLSMEREGFEADKDRIFIADLNTGQKTDYSTGFDYSAQNLLFTPDSKTLVFIAGVQATFQIYSLNLETRTISPITSGLHDYHSVALANGCYIGSKVSMIKPAEIYRIDPASGQETELSFENKHILDKLAAATIEKRMVKTADNKEMLTWVILPPHFDASKKYPALLYCEGGPQSPVSQFWSYRWNFSIMAANDYVIVAPCRRGVTTMGQAWTDAISKDHGGMEMKDLLAAIDQVKKEPFIDDQRLGAIGASYGGYSVFWLAGNHQKRFKAFIAHCGVFNSEMEYMTTDEMFFDDWEMGGAPWEKDNKIAARSYASSPHLFVKNWDTPIMIIHGGRDFRIPYTQGMAAFNTAQLLGIPSRFLFFPEENHWVLKPQNGILWQRNFFDWLDRWLKK